MRLDLSDLPRFRPMPSPNPELSTSPGGLSVSTYEHIDPNDSHPAPQSGSFDPQTTSADLDSDDSWLHSSPPSHRPLELNRDQVPSFNNLSPHDHPPQDLQSNRTVESDGQQSQSLNHLTGHQLNLSCLQSDGSDASVTSLSYSFPDPTTSCDQPISNIHPAGSISPSSTCPSELDLETDHLQPPSLAHSSSDDWTSTNSEGLSSPSEHSHDEIPPSPSKFRQSPLPLSNALDQQHPSPSPVQRPGLALKPGSDASQQLTVFLCGGRVSSGQLRDISIKIRMNFAPHDLSSQQSSPAVHHPYASHSPDFSRPRLRKAISCALERSSPPDLPITTRALLYQTSWLQITLHDLTSLSGHDQRAFFLSLSEQPGLILYNIHLSSCFPPEWLQDLFYLRPTQIDHFKILPILVNEPSTTFKALLQHIAVLCGKDPPEAPMCVSEWLMTAAIPPNLLLGTRESLDTAHSTHDLGRLSASSTSQLHQLLMPIKPLIRPEEKHDAMARSKLFGVICFLAAMTIYFIHHMHGSGAELAPRARGPVESYLTNPAEYPHHLPVLASQPSLSAYTSTSRPRMRSPSASGNSGDPAALFEGISGPGPAFLGGVSRPTDLGEITAGHRNRSLVGCEPGSQAVITIVASSSVVSGHGDWSKDNGDQVAREGTRRASARLAKAPALSATDPDHVDRPFPPTPVSQCKPAHASGLKILGPSICTALKTMRPTKVWAQRLPRRVRKGLWNIQRRPEACVKKIWQSRLPRSFYGSNQRPGL